MQRDLSPRRRLVLAPRAIEGLEPRRLFAATYAITDLTPNLPANATATAYGVSNNGAVALGYNGHAAYSKGGVLHDLGFNGYATDINDNGVLCGVDQQLGYERPFVYANGVETFPLGDGVQGVAAAINSSGTVVGTENSDAQDAAVGFFTNAGGSPTVVDVPPGSSFFGFTGINDKGQIVGNVGNPGPGGSQAFIYGNGTFKRLPPPYQGGSDYPTTSVVRGLTNDGTIAFTGTATNSTFNGQGLPFENHILTVNSNGFGPTVDHGTLAGAYDIETTDINAGGTIVANAFDANYASQPVVDTAAGGVRTLQSLISANDKWTLQTAAAVNDSGQIVGNGLRGSGTHAYLLTPVAVAGSISGTVFNDNDADGVFDSNEVGSGVRTVFLDANRNNKLDSGEVSVQSDASGKYTFTGLAAGDYHVERVLPSGYHLSNNANGYVEVNLVAGQAATNVNLGSAANVTPPKVGSIAGVVFNDDDRDGVYDSNESPSGVRTVFLDVNGNGKLDSGEKSTQSTAAGVYKFDGLAAGSYKISRVFPSGYHLTGTAAKYLTITVAAGQNVTNANIGSGKNV